MGDIEALTLNELLQLEAQQVQHWLKLTWERDEPHTLTFNWLGLAYGAACKTHEKRDLA